MGKAISGKKKKTQRKKAKPEFAYRRKCSVPPGQHCPQYTRTKQRQKKFRKLRMCATSEEDTDPGVELYNKYWTFLQEGERLFADPNFYKDQTTTSADAASQRKTIKSLE